MEIDVSPSDTMNNDMEYSGIASENKYVTNNNEQYSIIRIPEDTDKSSKHSSRKQSKRRKKSSNHSRPLPRIIVKPLPPPPPPETREWTAASSYSDPSTTTRPSTMREVLASIPGFCMKPRKRSGKKLSTAAQLQQTREGCIDLETPDSILVNTNIRALLNKHTFSLLPPLYQYKLGQLLPSVDRPSPSGRLNSSSLNNEFFARACLEWQDGLSGGEFTPENQQKMKTEAEKEKSKIDPWKLKHFEPFWGEKLRREKSTLNLNSDRPSLKTTIKLRPTASITSSSTVPKVKKSKSSSNSKRMRSVGAVTRSSAKTDDTVDELNIAGTKSNAPVPDLLPLKQIKGSNLTYEEYQVDFNFSDSSSAQRLDDSVSSTPIDPLLLTEVEVEKNESKQSLDISIVSIEEFSASKTCEDIKSPDIDNHLQEVPKRLSEDNNGYTSAKRIKFEEDYVIDNAGFSAHNTEIGSTNFSDSITYDNEQVCPNDELLYSRQDLIDTNSDDSKATPSGYEYDERSESSVSSLKIETSLNNVSVNNENSENLETPGAPISNLPEVSESNEEFVKESPVHSHPDVYEEAKFQECAKPEESTLDVEISNKSPDKDLIGCRNYEIVEKEDVQESLEKNEMEFVDKEENNSDKCEEKEKQQQNIVHTYYDEHFKDAESFILETSLAILTSRKSCLFVCFILN